MNGSTQQLSTARFTVEAGMVIRGQVRREIETEAWRRGLEIETAESKSWIESTYRFTVRGPAEGVRRFVLDCDRWAKELETDV